MQFKVFQAFMAFFRTHINRAPTTEDLKVYVKGGYVIRIGPCLFRYNWTTGCVEQIAGPFWPEVEFDARVHEIFNS